MQRAVSRYPEEARLLNLCPRKASTARTRKMAERIFAFLVLDTESIPDGRLLNLVKYPADNLSPAEAITASSSSFCACSIRRAHHERHRATRYPATCRAAHAAHLHCRPGPADRDAYHPRSAGRL